MQNHETQPLPLPLIEELFTKLITAWGRAFLDQWAGVEIEAIHDDWAEKLAWTLRTKKGVPSAPAIDYALGMLPEKPLNVIAFNKLCRGWSPPVQRALGLETKPMPEMFKEKMAELHAPLPDEPERVRWARRYIALWGHKEPLIQRRQQDLDRARFIVQMHEETVEAARRREAQVPA